MLGGEAHARSGGLHILVLILGSGGEGDLSGRGGHRIDKLHPAAGVGRRRKLEAEVRSGDVRGGREGVLQGDPGGSGTRVFDRFHGGEGWTGRLAHGLSRLRRRHGRRGRRGQRWLGDLRGRHGRRRLGDLRDRRWRSRRHGRHGAAPARVGLNPDGHHIPVAHEAVPPPAAEGSRPVRPYYAHAGVDLEQLALHTNARDVSHGRGFRLGQGGSGQAEEQAA